MQILDRKTAPEIFPIDQIKFIEPQKSTLSNGIPLFVVNAGSQDVVKIQFLFNAGTILQTKPLTAFITSKMLTEGTKSHSANEIAGIFDFCGAFIEAEADKDFAVVNLYLLTKYTEKLLPLLEEIIKFPTFPANELLTLMQNKQQEFIVNNEKVSTIARTKFNEIIFGENHPYGKNAKEDDFDNLKSKDLVDFHKKHYNSNNCSIIIAGKVAPRITDLLNHHFGGKDWEGNKETVFSFPEPIVLEKKDHFIEKQNVMQCGLRVGKLLFNKTQKDFCELQVLNTVLGGYFGSRLMNNIREDKGYTYGIGSGLISLKNSGYFFISSEVGQEVCSKAIDEIKLELKKLRTELIPKHELDLVRNYMLGTFLRSIDGPFAMADRFLGIYQYGLNYDYYQSYIKTIKNITSSCLLELSEAYFHEDSMSVLIVGKK